MECNNGFFSLLKHFFKRSHKSLSMLSEVLSAAKSLQAGSSLKIIESGSCAISWNILKPTCCRVFHLILDVFVTLVSDFLVSSSSGQGVKDNFHIRCQSKTSEAAEVGNHRQTESLHRTFHVGWNFWDGSWNPKISWTSGVCESATAIGGVSLW